MSVQLITVLIRLLVYAIIPHADAGDPHFGPSGCQQFPTLRLSSLAATAPRDARGRLLPIPKPDTSGSKKPGYGTSRAYRVARLKRDRPDLAARMIAGQLSAAEALRQAAARGSMRRVRPERSPDRPRRAILWSRSPSPATIARRGDRGDDAIARRVGVCVIGEWGWPNGHGVNERDAATTYGALANSDADAMFFFQYPACRGYGMRDWGVEETAPGSRQYAFFPTGEPLPWMTLLQGFWGAEG